MASGIQGIQPCTSGIRGIPLARELYQGGRGKRADAAFAGVGVEWGQGFKAFSHALQEYCRIPSVTAKRRIRIISEKTLQASLRRFF